MKKFKGFSLAELLIALGIISIITTMGIQISKKGIERAYNYYYYTAYMGVQNIITDCTRKNKELTTENFNPTWNEYIKDYLAEGTTTETIDTTPFFHPNIFQTKLTFKNIIVAATPGSNQQVNGFKYTGFIVSIPAPNQKRKFFELLYFPDIEGGVLIPSPKEDAAKNVVSLLNRPDLLPTYVDDGIVGRIRNTYDPTTGNYIIDSSAYQRPRLQDYKTTYCETIGKNLNGIITCPTGSPSEEGTLKIANPKKFF